MTGPAGDGITVEVDPGIDDYLADDRIDRWLWQCRNVCALAVVATAVLDLAVAGG